MRTSRLIKPETPTVHVKEIFDDLPPWPLSNQALTELSIIEIPTSQISNITLYSVDFGF